MKEPATKKFSLKAIFIIAFLFANMLINAQDIRNITEIDGEKLGSVTSIYKDKQEDFWIGTSNGLFLIDKTGNKKLFDKDIKNANIFFKDSKGLLYVYCDTYMGKNVVAWFDGTKWHKININYPLATFVGTFAEDNDNNLWCMSNTQIYKIKKSNIEKFTIADGIPDFKKGSSYFGYLILLKNNTVVAISEKNGYSFYDGTKWERHKKINDKKLIINSQAVVNEKLWIGTNKGIYVWENSTFIPLENQPTPESNIDDIFCLDDKITIISSTKAFIYTNGKWETFKPNKKINFVMPDKLRNLWFETDKEICYKYSENGKITEFPVNLSTSYIIHSGEEGKMLYADGGRGGYNIGKIYYYNGKEFKKIKTPKFYNHFKKVIRIKKESYYLAPHLSGLLHFDGSKFTEIKKKNGLLANEVRCLKKYNNELWVGTRKGISILKLN